MASLSSFKLLVNLTITLNTWSSARRMKIFIDSPCSKLSRLRSSTREIFGSMSFNRGSFLIISQSRRFIESTKSRCLRGLNSRLDEEEEEEEELEDGERMVSS